jgi:hypothetical protein
MADTVKLVMVQRGGWSAHYGRWDQLSGHARDIPGTMTDLALHDHRYAPGCLLVDTTAIPDEAVVVLGMSRPMVDVDLAPGMVRKLSGEIMQWDGGGARFIGTAAPAVLQDGDALAEVMVSDDPRARLEELGANPEGSVFGNAGAYNDVAIDVYVAIARRFGAQVIPVDEAFAAVDLRRTLDGLDTEENPEAPAGMIDHALDLVESFAALGDEARAAGLPVQASGSPAAPEEQGGRLSARLDAARASEPPGLGI